MSDYERIARAITYLQERVTAQPSLAELAAHVYLSPFHFQRLFSRWAGTTPKRFLQVLTLELGKNLLQQPGSLLEVADNVGLSSSSRLHDHFVQLEAVTPGEYRSRGQNLEIVYGMHATSFGSVLIAQTTRGICRAAFLDSDNDALPQLQELQRSWPLASLRQDQPATAGVAAALTGSLLTAERPLSLHLHGTNFQLAVWRALLRIPPGRAVSYGDVAAAIGRPKAVRAVGTAIGANPAAFLIPCHRVIQQSGALGGYRWGPVRKQAMQVWERVRNEGA